MAHSHEQHPNTPQLSLPFSSTFDSLPPQPAQVAPSTPSTQLVALKPASGHQAPNMRTRYVQRGDTAGYTYRTGLLDAPPTDSTFPFEYMTGITIEELLIFFPNQCFKHWPAVAARIRAEGISLAEQVRLVHCGRLGQMQPAERDVLFKANSTRNGLMKAEQNFFSALGFDYGNKPIATAQQLSTTAWQRVVRKGEVQEPTPTWSIRDIACRFPGDITNLPDMGAFTRLIKAEWHGIQAGAPTRHPVLSNPATTHNPPSLPVNWVSGRSSRFKADQLFSSLRPATVSMDSNKAQGRQKRKRQQAFGTRKKLSIDRQRPASPSTNPDESSEAADVSAEDTDDRKEDLTWWDTGAYTTEPEHALDLYAPASYDTSSLSEPSDWGLMLDPLSEQEMFDMAARLQKAAAEDEGFLLEDQMETEFLAAAERSTTSVNPECCPDFRGMFAAGIEDDEQNLDTMYTSTAPYFPQYLPDLELDNRGNESELYTLEAYSIRADVFQPQSSLGPTSVGSFYPFEAALPQP